MLLSDVIERSFERFDPNATVHDRSMPSITTVQISNLVTILDSAPFDITIDTYQTDAYALQELAFRGLDGNQQPVYDRQVLSAVIHSYIAHVLDIEEHNVEAGLMRQLRQASIEYLELEEGHPNQETIRQMYDREYRRVRASARQAIGLAIQHVSNVANAFVQYATRMYEPESIEARKVEGLYQELLWYFIPREYLQGNDQIQIRLAE